MKFSTIAIFAALVVGATPVVAQAQAARAPFMWENATVYFLLTDRFNNGNPANDHAYGRKADAAPLRGFAGGDLAGVTAKIKAGYFKDLGVDVLWMTPPVEQIHAATDEGSGRSYGFHGYWAKDFTSVDANLGSEDDMRALVDAAHANGMRVLLDVVMNHTGPVTSIDSMWPIEWVRTAPQCTYHDVVSTVDCVLVKNLPDIRTGSNEDVGLPWSLVGKWRGEGRYDKEVKELDAFFARTHYPRAPRYYLIKWHADWVRKYGFDGFRADTVKHVEPGVWKELKQEASAAYEEWKRANPTKKLGDDKFFMTAEVYNYSIMNGKRFDLGGGTVVNYFDNGFDSLINFSMKSDAAASYESLFAKYSAQLNGPLKGYSVLNYMSSHDDGQPFDAERKRSFETATKLLLAPGAAQIYYGDETARKLTGDGAVGDAALRSFMNWEALAADPQVAKVRAHWSRLGLFRRAHPAIGAGVHQKLQEHPYVFRRSFDRNGVHDQVVVALDLLHLGVERAQGVDARGLLGVLCRLPGTRDDVGQGVAGGTGRVRLHRDLL
ncbi:MAG: alpha-amylase family glycosyl hydrolase, partial [Pseudomonadota bacterium]